MFPTVDQLFAPVLFRYHSTSNFVKKKRKPIDTEQGYYFCYMITHTIKVCFTTSSSTCISENSYHQSNGNLHVSKKTRSSTSCKNLDGFFSAKTLSQTHLLQKTKKPNVNSKYTEGLQRIFCESHLCSGDSLHVYFQLQQSFAIISQVCLRYLPSGYQYFSLAAVSKLVFSSSKPSKPILHEYVVKQNCFYYVFYLSSFIIVLII